MARTATMPREIQTAAEIEHEHESTDVYIGDLSDILDRPDTPGWHGEELADHSPGEIEEMMVDFEERR